MEVKDPKFSVNADIGTGAGDGRFKVQYSNHAHVVLSSSLIKSSPELSFHFYYCKEEMGYINALTLFMSVIYFKLPSYVCTQNII